jgi:hypothetical protein
MMEKQSSARPPTAGMMYEKGKFVIEGGESARGNI